MRLYEEIVGRGGISPSYFFDSMTLEECAAYIRGYQRKEQEKWERMRWLMYTIAQVNSKKKLSPEDLFSFPWDKERGPVEVDEKEIEEVRKRMKGIKL